MQRIKAKFERSCKDRAINEIIKLKTILPADEYRDEMRAKLSEFEGIGRDGKPLLIEVETQITDDKGEPRTDAGGNPVLRTIKVQNDYSYDSPRLKAIRETDWGRLAHVRTMIDGGELWSDEDLENLLLEKGDEIIAFTSACSARVEELLKDLGPDPDPKEAARRLKQAGWWA